MDRLDGQIDGGSDHHLQPQLNIARVIRMNRREGTLMACVHRLQHVESFCAPTFTDNDAVGPHAKRVFDKVMNRVRTSAFDVGWFRLHLNYVPFDDLQLRSVFDCYDPLVVWNKIS